MACASGAGAATVPFRRPARGRPALVQARLRYETEQEDTRLSMPLKYQSMFVFNTLLTHAKLRAAVVFRRFL